MNGAPTIRAAVAAAALLLTGCATAEPGTDGGVDTADARAEARAARTSDAAPERTYRLYVANESSDLVSRVVFTPGEGGRVDNEIPVGLMPGDIDGAHGLTVSPDGDRFYVTIAHGQPFGTVWQFAAGADTLIDRTTLGLFPATMGLTPDGQFLGVVNFNLHGDPVPSNVSVVYTPTMTEVARVTTCVMPHGSRVDASGARHYSACMHSDQLVELDLSSFEVSRRFDLTPGGEGPLPAADTGAAHGEGHVAPRPGGPDAIRHDEPNPRRGEPQRADEVDREDLIRRTGVDEEGEPRETEMRHRDACSPTWAEPGEGERANRFLYVACNRNGEILEIDVEGWEVSRRFATGQGPYNLEITPDGTLLVATLKGEQKIAVFDLETGEERARLDTSEPVTHGVVVSPDGRYAFVTNEAVGSTPGTLDVFDLATLELVETIELAHQPGGVDFWRMEEAGTR